MATTPEHKPTIAPIVGPDDPRRFTDSGIEIKTRLHRGGRRAAAWRSASASPASTRSPAASTRTCTARASGRCASTRATPRAKETNERFHYLIEHGSTGPLDGLRPAHPARPRLRRPALRGRGRAHRRGHRLDRRHAPRVRRHPARRGLHVDDDQRARPPCCCCSTSWSARSRACRVRAAARHHPERHPQGVHRPRELHLPARAGDAADHGPVRLLPRARARSGTRSRSPATTCARRAARRCRRWASRSPTRSPTCRPRSTPGSTSTSSARGWPSSSTATTTSSRRWPSSAPRGGCGRGS